MYFLEAKAFFHIGNNRVETVGGRPFHILGFRNGQFFVKPEAGFELFKVIVTHHHHVALPVFGDKNGFIVFVDDS